MTTKLTAPSGSTVSVDDEQVESLLAAGFTRQQSSKSTGSKSSPSSSGKSSSSK